MTIYNIPGHPPRTSPRTVSAVWRVDAADFDVDAFAQRFPVLDQEGIHRRGEPGRKGPIATSGFNQVLTNEGEFEEALAMVLETLEELKPALRHLSTLGILSEIDFGLLVGGDDHCTRSAGLSPDELRPFVEAGVSLTFTAYPWGDDDDDDDE